MALNCQNMNLTELKAEAAARYKQAEDIERKYMGRVIDNAEDEQQVKALLSEVDELEAWIPKREASQAAHDRIQAGIERFTRVAPGQHVNPFTQEILEAKRVDPGTQFINSREYKDLLTGGVFNSNFNRTAFGVTMRDGTSLIDWAFRLQTKDLLYGGTGVGDIAVNDRRPGLIDIAQRPIVVLDLIPRQQTGSDTVEYVREDTFTNAAAFTAEATATTGTDGTKPESALAYSVQTGAVKTLAHWIPVTNKMLADVAQTRGMINGRLLVGLNLALETQVVAGDGTGENFTGLLNTAGILIQGKGSDSALDAIFKARTQVRVTGNGTPGAVVLHPNDWEAIRLSRESAATATPGTYLMGPPSQVGATTVWGIPVTESQAITENTGLIGDFQMGCALYDREQAAIRVGTINDQFTRNIQTILAELRAAFVVFRPTMFAKITGI